MYHQSIHQKKPTSLLFLSRTATVLTPHYIYKKQSGEPPSESHHVLDIFQAWYQQIDQFFEVLIARLFCREGHDPFRESRQAGKAVIEIASRANDLAVRALMVDLLNADRSNIEKLHTMERKRRDALRSQGIDPDPHNPLAVSKWGHWDNFSPKR